MPVSDNVTTPANLPTTYIHTDNPQDTKCNLQCHIAVFARETHHKLFKYHVHFYYMVYVIKM